MEAVDAKPAELNVRLAVPSEVDLVLDVLSDAASWLRGRGIEQWPRRFPVESVAEGIDDQIVHLVHVGDEVAATFALHGSDPEWPGEPSGDALYLGRLAVVRKFAGRGLGHRIVDWCVERARQERCTYLRLLTSRDNPALRAWYEAAGFIHRGDPTGAKWPVSCYERELRRRRD